MNARKKLHKIHANRATRVRAKILGTSERPRLSVFKSNQYTYVQLIDDSIQKTIASASTRIAAKSGKSEASAKSVNLGEVIAKKAAEKGIKKAVFDRGRYKFHGVVKSIVDEARKSGLTI